MKEYDCGFRQENIYFRYRAAAIVVENGCVLFAGNEKEDYLYSVGGAVRMGETAEDAVMREVFEETGLRYEIERPAIIHESFFEVGNGVCCHELSFYFLMKPRGTQELNAGGMTQGVPEQMYWIPIDELERHRAFPVFMKDWLSREHTGIEHIVTDERKM